MRVIIKTGGLILLGVCLVAGVAVPRFVGKKAPVAPSRPGGTRPLIQAGTSAWKVTRTDKGEGTVNIVPVQKAPAGIKNALHIEVTQPGPYHNAVAVQRLLPFALRKDQKLTVQFWARATPEAVGRIICMGADQETERSRSLDVKQPLTPEWKQYSLTFVMKEDYPEAGAKLCLRVGAAAATYEFSQLELIAP